ncbi:hypothetical protein STRDD10_00571 [Streptococcus sp. DD10]|nr:hypothetical protein STRDD10_00571 [Streptococcus sp. DD10]
MKRVDIKGVVCENSFQSKSKQFVLTGVFPFVLRKYGIL